VACVQVVLPVVGHDEKKDGPMCHVIWIMNADLRGVCRLHFLFAFLSFLTRCSFPFSTTGWLPTWLVESTLCGVMNRWVKTVRTAITDRYKQVLPTLPENLPSPSAQLNSLKPKA
jgi:hypothetical protein